MGGYFVWKDAAGRLSGYLMHRDDEVCCRVDGQESGMEVMLFYGDGTQETHAVECGTEARWPDGGHELLGGVALSSDAVCMDTGKAARDAYARQRLRSGMQVKAEARAAPSSRAGHSMGAAEERAMGHGTWPQRRWPPPPCHPQAVYVRGQWREEERDDEEG